MTNPAVARLAARLAALEGQVRGLSAPSLAFSAIEDGAVQEFDGTGRLVQIIGTQFDGTHMAAPVGGPPPPQPSRARVTVIPNGLTIAWDGEWVNAIIPMDFSRIEVHLVPQGQSYTGSAETLRETIETPRGADVTVSPLPLVPHTVLFVARSLSGVASIPSEAVTATPIAGVTASEMDKLIAAAQSKTTTRVSASPPTAQTPGTTGGDLWLQLRNNFIIAVFDWTGTAWVARQLDNAVIASMSVSKLLSGDLVPGTRLQAGPTALSSTGLEYARGEGQVSRLGRPNSSDFWGVTDGAGIQTAGMDDTGRLSGRALDVTEEVRIAGRPVSQIVSDFSRIIAQGSRSTASASTTTADAEYLEIQTQVPYNRMVKVVATGLGLTNNTAGARMMLRIRYAVDGDEVTVASEQLVGRRYSTPVASTAMAASDLTYYLRNTTHPAGREFRFLLTVACEQGTGSISPQGTVYLQCEDWGPVVPDIGLERNPASSPTATQPPADATRKVQVLEYASTGSATYRGDGTRRLDTPDVVQGISPTDTASGDQRGLWVFPTTMQTDLAGSTVTKVEVWAYAHYWDAPSGGTARVFVHPHAPNAALSTYPGVLTTGATVTDWPKTGGRWVTLPSSLYAGFANGTYKGFAVGPAGTTVSTFYGHFDGGTGAKIRVTFVK